MTITVRRRGFLGGLLAMPAIIPTSRLMRLPPVGSFRAPPRPRVLIPMLRPSGHLGGFLVPAEFRDDLLGMLHAGEAGLPIGRGRPSCIDMRRAPDLRMPENV